MATFGPTSAVWFLSPFAAEAPDADAASSLTTSLAETLSLFPHFSGTLSLTPYSPSAGSELPRHTQRFRRCVIRHGYSADPGVQLVIVKANIQLNDFVPISAVASGADSGLYDLTPIPLQKLLPTTPVPICDTINRPDVPAFTVQLTTFACGSLAIGLRAAHPLADAETLSSFIKAWGYVHRGGVGSLNGSRAVFNPKLLDDQAIGDIDSHDPDPALVAKSHELPIHRHDWWVPNPNCPGSQSAQAQSEIPAEIPVSVASARFQGVPIPWDEWDRSLPVSHALIRLSANEVVVLYNSVVKRGPVLEVTVHDVLLAFFWSLIVRAKHQVATGNVHLGLSLGLRSRLDLPSTYVGSPILLTGMTESMDEFLGPELTRRLSLVARKIRNHVRIFDKDAIGTYLHEMAFDIAPHRFWGGFLGRRHTIATSWIRSGMYDVDFGSGPPLWVASAVSNVDGIVVIMEAGKPPEGSKWWSAGVFIDLNLEESATQRILKSVREWRATLN